MNSIIPTPTIELVVLQVLILLLCIFALMPKRASVHWIDILLVISLLFSFYSIAPISRSQLEDNPFDSTRLLRIGFIALSAVLCGMALLLRQNKRVFPISLWLFIAFCFLALISAVYSPNVGLTLFKSIELTTDVMLGLTIALYLQTVQDVRKTLDLVYACFVFLLVSAIVNIAFFPDLSLPWTRSAILPFRLRGSWPLINTNELAQMASICLGVFTIRAISAYKDTNFMIGGFVILLSTLVLVLTASRTSWVTVVLLLAYISWMTRSKVLLFVVLVSGGVGMYLGIQELLVEYFLRGESSESIVNLGGRSVIWPVYFDQFMASPIFGNGFYAAHRFFDPAILAEHGLRGVEETISTTDNTYLEILLGLGIIGFLFMGLFLNKTWRDIRVVGNVRRIRNIDKDVIVNVPRSYIIQLSLELKVIFFVILLRSFTGPTFASHSYNSVLLSVLMACAGTMAILISIDKKFRSG